MTEIEKVKAEIKVLEKKLALLEEIEKQPRMTFDTKGQYVAVSYNKTTYYRFEGEITFSWYMRKGVSLNHPAPTLVMVTDAETERLLEGVYYNEVQIHRERERERIEENLETSVQEMVSGDVRPIDDVVKEAKKQQIKDAVRESVKWCEEHPDKDPLDWVKSRDEFMDKLIAELKGQTLTDIIWKWWEDVFTTHSDWDAENAIDELVNRIESFLPKEQSAAGSQNAHVECTVEGFNDCLNKIKRKLR